MVVFEVRVLRVFICEERGWGFAIVHGKCEYAVHIIGSSRTVR